MMSLMMHDANEQVTYQYHQDMKALVNNKELLLEQLY